MYDIEKQAMVLVSISKGIASIYDVLPKSNVFTALADEMVGGTPVEQFIKNTTELLNAFSGSGLAEGEKGLIAQISEMDLGTTKEDGTIDENAVGSLQSKVDTIVSISTAIASMYDSLPEPSLWHALTERVDGNPFENLTTDMTTMVGGFNDFTEQMSLFTEEDLGAYDATTGMYEIQKKADLMTSVALGVAAVLKAQNEAYAANTGGYYVDDSDPLAGLVTAMSGFATDFNGFAAEMALITTENLGGIDENGAYEIEKKATMMVAVATAIGGLTAAFSGFDNVGGAIEKAKEWFIGDPFTEINEHMDTFATGFNTFATHMSLINYSTELDTKVTNAIGMFTDVAGLFETLAGMNIEEKKSKLMEFFTGESKTDSVFTRLGDLCTSLQTAGGQIAGLKKGSLQEDVGVASDIITDFAGILNTFGTSDEYTGVADGVSDFDFASQALGTIARTVQQADEYFKTVDMSTTGSILNSVGMLMNGLAVIAENSLQGTSLDFIQGELSSTIAAIPGMLSPLDGVTVDQANLDKIANGLGGIAGIIDDPNLTIANGEKITSLSNTVKTLSDILSNEGEYQLNTADFLSSLNATDITTGLTGFIDTVQPSLTNATTAFTTSTSGFSTASSDLAKAINTGVSGSLDSTWASTYISTCLSAFDGIWEKFRSKGQDAGSGFVSGVRSYSQFAYSAGSQLGRQALSGAQNALKSGSPSREFMKLGRYSVEGMAIGLTNYSRIAETSAEHMATSVIDTAKGPLADMSRLISEDMDTVPVVRPVVDLSDVTASARSMNGMLGGNRAITMNASVSNARNISSSMSARKKSQNAASSVVPSTTNTDNSVNFSGSSFYIRSDQDVHNLAYEIASLTRQQQRSLGASY